MDKIFEFAGNHPLLVAALVGSLLFAIFTELRRKASGLIEIEASDAVKLINNDAIVIDVRGAEAYGAGHIVNARNIPSDELEAKSATLEQYKTKPVIAVCDAGISSKRAVNALKALGFESAYSLRGGMGGWTRDGLPVVTGKKTRSKSGKGKKRG